MTEVSRILMVRPDYFGFNSETSATNTFQKSSNPKGAMAEFDVMADRLARQGIELMIFDGAAGAPDAVFPNNWVSFHPEAVVLYPMLAVNRRLERRTSIVREVIEDSYAGRPGLIDLSPYEEQGEYLEGTGSIIFNYKAKKAYAALSPRTYPRPLKELCSSLGYRDIIFTAASHAGVPVYHTNVLMALGNTMAVVCKDMIAGGVAALYESLQEDGLSILGITPGQMEAFAGNIYLLRGSHGPFWLMSESARKSFSREQLGTLERDGEILSVHIPGIEGTGGGSVRCMIAEIKSA